jgi:hypothetical protein
MQGEKISEGRGKVTGRRILPGGDYRYVRMEISFEEQGTAYGVQGMNMGTYTVFERVPGQLYGEGQGIFMSMEGESAIWNGHGVGHMADNGAMVFAFSLAFQAGSGKLERLNNVLGVGENHTDMEGNSQTTVYEWKA